MERRRKDEAMLKMPEQAEKAQIRPLPQVPASCEGEKVKKIKRCEKCGAKVSNIPMVYDSEKGGYVRLCQFHALELINKIEARK